MWYMEVIITILFPFSEKGGVSGHMCTYWNMIWQRFERLCFLYLETCLKWMQPHPLILL
jgi:hypothetical protein